jgi:pimeloyl-ACP methyl ester carboxylesterase
MRRNIRAAEVRMSDPRIAGRHRPIQVSYRDVGSVRTRCLELAGDGAPLICLHGYSDQADTWRPLMRALQHTQRHVIAFDLPGFGRAGALQPGPILPQLDRFVAAATLDAEAASGQAPILIGNSLGGFAALRAASDRDLPIAGVVPISPAGFGHSRTIKLAERPGGVTTLLERGLLPMPVLRGVMSLAFRSAACPDPRQADGEAVKAWVGQFHHRSDLVRVLGNADQLLAEIHAAPRDVPIEVPILLLWGDRDRLTLQRGARHICRANPHTEFVPLRGSGHCPQLQIAPRIADLVTEWADRVLAGRRRPLHAVGR